MVESVDIIPTIVYNRSVMMTTSRGDTTHTPLSSVSPQLEAAAEAGWRTAGGWRLGQAGTSGL